jgi:uncharacterized protein YkwD
LGITHIAAGPLGPSPRQANGDPNRPASTRRSLYPRGVPPPLIVRAVALVLSVGFLAAPIPCVRSAESAGTVDLAPEWFKDEVLALLNQERVDAGLPVLADAPALDAVAVARAIDMAASGYFAHIRPGGASAETLLRSYGIPYVRMGENIARSNDPPDVVVFVVHYALMASSGHRANMLDEGFGQVGIGIAIVNGTYYFAVVFVDDRG